MFARIKRRRLQKNTTKTTNIGKICNDDTIRSTDVQTTKLKSRFRFGMRLHLYITVSF